MDSLALNVSSDGSVVVGWSESSNGREAFRWTEAGGMVGLGDLQGGVLRSIASGISADGSVIVGTGNSTGTFFGEAFLWTQPTGMMNLKEFLATGGATGLTGWTLLGDVYVSGDGTRIAGTGRNPAGLLEPWIATIPPIPEPSTWALAACALFFGGLLVRRRRKFARALASGV
ncbi:MAG: PEP-CTERM sorting domain-containing protein [Pirellulales bacterium]